MPALLLLLRRVMGHDAAVRNARGAAARLHERRRVNEDVEAFLTRLAEDDAAPARITGS